MNKNELRKMMLTTRKKINNKNELSTKITNRIIDLEVYKKAKVIALYKSLKDEVDTSLLINKSLKEKIVLLPRITTNKMIFVKINLDTKYNKSSFGVLEPIGEEYNGEIDLIIVPGVSFDIDGNRLGYGKGYYDRFLNNKNIYKIGICFKEQLVNHLIVDDNDIPVNLVITDK